MSETSEEMNGISFMRAIEKRYVETCIIPKDVLHLPQMEGKDRTIELIGFEKTFKRLIEVNVSQMNISYCGYDNPSLKQVLSQTKALVLSHNLLTDWSEVSKIIQNLESLSDLVLSYNKLKVPETQELDYNWFQSIKTLIIDNMDYEWADVLFCSQMWPNIERLDVWGNKITELRAPEAPIFDNLNYLSLCNNDIQEWTQVCKLGSLPNLKTLNVSNCNLKEIHFDSDLNNKTKLFPQLESLLISSNNLSKWSDVSALNKLQTLNNLLIKNNPVFDNEKYDTNFNLIIARIGNLKVLNKENVTQMMRRDAEISYLRKFYKDYETIKISNKEKLGEFLTINPRFEEILLIFGVPVGAENLSKAEIERKKFLTIKFQNPFDHKIQIEKKLPGSISIINLKTIIRKIFNIDYNYDINLLWTSKNFECPLDKESQNLNFYAIENGDTIVVNIEYNS